MPRKLLDKRFSEPVSPLIDLVVNALAAIFIILMVYMFVARPTNIVAPSCLENFSAPPAIQGQNYLFNLPVVGGQGKISYKLMSEPLPNGLSLELNSGTIMGVPMLGTLELEAFDVAIEASDERGFPTLCTFELLVYETAIPFSPSETPLTFNRSELALPIGRVGESYEAVFGAFGGVEPYLWSLVEGNLPQGLQFIDGKLVGTPEIEGIFSLTVDLRYTNGQFTFRDKIHEWFAEEKRDTFTLEILPERPQPMIGDTFFQVWKDEPFSFIIPHQGFVEPLSSTINSSTPESISIQGSRIEGELNELGTYKIELVFEDALNHKAEGIITLSVRNRPLQILFPETIDLLSGQPIYFPLTATGGSGNYTWHLEEVTPPNNNFVLENSIISGIVNSIGEWQLSISVMDDLSEEALSKTLTINANYIDNTQPVFAASSIPNATLGQSYTFYPSVLGGVGNIDFEFEGTLQDGLQYTSLGIEGTPTELGSNTITINATDDVGQRIGPIDLTLDVVAQDQSTPQIMTSNLPIVIPGEPYLFDFSAEGGIGSYSWEVLGEMPPGISHSSNKIVGVLSPQSSRTIWPISVKVIDEIGQSSVKTFQLTLIDESPDSPDICEYVVQSNDTLYNLEEVLGNSVENFTELNNLTEPDNIEVGQVLLYYCN